MSVDDPEDYTTDRFEVLAQIDNALSMFEAGDTEPFAFGDGPQAQAWLVYAPSYDAFARARRWLDADRALQADPDNAELKRAYDEAAELALHEDRPGPVLGELPVLSPQDWVAVVPELTARIRAGSLTPVAAGRAGRPEAVLVPHEQYSDLVRSHMLWHQSPPFLATLDPAVHKPMAKSRKIDLDEFFRSLGPTSARLWEERQERKAQRTDDEGS